MNGMTYAVKTVRILSDSVPDKFYDVVKFDNGRWTCNCPHFVKGRQNKGLDIWSRDYCKHIQRAIEQQAQGPAQPERRVEQPLPKSDLEKLNLSPELKALLIAID
ncbi:MAG: hypothetical protein ABSB40_00820 [Nitrososphaeria archaeon]